MTDPMILCRDQGVDDPADPSIWLKLGSFGSLGSFGIKLSMLKCLALQALEAEATRQPSYGTFMDGVVGGLSPSNLEFSEGLGAEAVHFSGLNMLEMQIIGHAADQSPGHKNRSPELPSIAMSSNVKHV